jgi:peptidylprolyl isomerase
VTQREKPEVDFPEGEPPADLVIVDEIAGEGAEATAGRTVLAHYVGVAFPRARSSTARGTAASRSRSR